MTRNNNPVYKIWKNIKARKDVSMDQEWYNNFELFEQYVGERPTSKSSLLRKDKKLGYIPENVEWKDSKIGMRLSVKSPKIIDDKLTANMSPREKLRLLAEVIGPVPEHLRDKPKVVPTPLQNHLDKVINEFRLDWIQGTVDLVNEKLAAKELTYEEADKLVIKVTAEFEEWLASPEGQEEVQLQVEAYNLRSSLLL